MLQYVVTKQQVFLFHEGCKYKLGFLSCIIKTDWLLSPLDVRWVSTSKADCYEVWQQKNLIDHNMSQV